jgi:Family of unknown function (DUF5309)
VPSPMVTNAFTTYRAQGNREDLSDKIYNIDPFDTPVISMVGRRTVKNRVYDWQTENLPVVDLANAREEGFELQRRAATPTVRQNNVTQISSRDATVSGSQEAADAAGKNSEMAHQMALQSKALKSDMESIACSRQPRVDGNDTTPTARMTESLPHAIARTKDRAGTFGAAVVGDKSALPTTAGGPFAATAGASQVVFDEITVGNAMQTAYTNGAEPTKLVVPPAIKRTISTFKGRDSSQVMVGKTEVVATVDIIATDFGRITALPSRWMPSDLAMQLDPEYAAIAFFRTFRQYPIAKVGDAETRMILAEWGTEMRNGLAHILYNGFKQGAVIGSP